jgi:exopolysaccharide production protein ExoF
MGMYHDLMAEAAQNDPLAGRDPSEALQISYSIVREADGKTTEMPAEENTAVLPGDVVKVRVSLPTSKLN